VVFCFWSAIIGVLKSNFDYMKKQLTILIIFVALTIFFAPQLAPNVSAASCTITSTLKYGARSADVLCLQEDLSVSPMTGYFGNITKAAVIIFQEKNGLTADGIVGPETSALLNGSTTSTTCPTGMVSSIPSAANNWLVCLPSSTAVQVTCPVGYIATTPVAPNFVACIPEQGQGSSITFSQSDVSLSTGQSISVTLYGSSDNNYYVSSNSNSSVVSASVSGSNLELYSSSNYGSSNILVCSSNSASSCGTVYVTVSGGSNSSITFSQNNVSLSTGQSHSVALYGSPNNSYYVSSNSNSSIVSASVSGNNLELYSNSNYGSSNILVCSSSGFNSCGTIYVTVSGGSNSSITFSQNNVSLSTGQSISVTLYGSSSNSYFLSSNSNSSVVSASVSGDILNLYGGSTNGSSSVLICSSSSFNSCGTVYVTVSGSSGSSITFSQNNVTLSTGQSISVTLYGSSSYYVLTNSNPSIVSTSVSGNTLNLYGNPSYGSVNIVVCSSSNSNVCGTLYVTVSSSGSASSITFSQNNVSLSTGQSISVTLYGSSSNSYLLSSNSNSSVVSASVSGDILNLYGGSTNGGSIVLVCSSNSYNICGSLYVTVN
jgi:epidermal growth factor receptor substrate 15